MRTADDQNVSRQILTAPLPDDVLDVHEQVQQGAGLVAERLLAVQEGHQDSKERSAIHATIACTP